MLLQKDEKIVLEVKSRMNVGLLIIGLITSIVFIGVFIIIWCLVDSKRKYIVTNKRLVIEGISGSTDLPLSKIESVQLLFGGTIKITGSGGKLTQITGVKNAEELANSISSQL